MTRLETHSGPPSDDGSNGDFGGEFVASLPFRVAMRRQSLSLQNMRSMRLRFL